MATNPPRWDPKYPQEVIPLGVDFVDLLSATDSLTAASTGITVVSGEDADPGSMLVGTPEISGTTVQQWVQGGVSGCSYRLVFTVDSQVGKRLVESGRVDVV